MVWFGTFCESLATLVYVVSSSNHFLFLNDRFKLLTTNSFNMSIHPAMTVGAFTTFAAALLRIWLV